MYEGPPCLTFTSLKHLKPKAIEVLNLQRTDTSPTPVFQSYEYPVAIDDKEKKRSKPNKKACVSCKKKKIKCDVNFIPPERCIRTSCQCLFHADQGSSDISTNDMTPAPFTSGIRNPGSINSGHFVGETAFCASFSTTLEQPSIIIEEDCLPMFTNTKTVSQPNLTLDDKLILINIYYENMNPFFPLMSKQILLKELDNILHHRKSHLSPLFFFALFARAAQIGVDSKKELSSNNKMDDISKNCFNYASALINEYRDKSRVSTILALVILANYLELQKKPAGLTQSWLWAGEAFRMSLDLGIHRSCMLDGDRYYDQLCIRAFWLAFITDSVISMKYGRPSSSEEKLLDTQSPKKHSEDDPITSQWIEELYILMEFSKATARIIRFNYCPPPVYTLVSDPVKRDNAFLVSVEDWLYDTIQKKQNPDQSNQDLISTRLNCQKLLMLYSNLILLHRPHVDETVVIKNAKKKPSYSVCAYAAILITDIANKLDFEDLYYHSKCPILAYALIMAIHIHILNATKPNPQKYNASINYQICISILSRLPQAQDKSSMLFDAIEALKRQADNDFLSAKQREEHIRIEQKVQLQKMQPHPNIIASQIIFSGRGQNVTCETPSSGQLKTGKQASFTVKGHSTQTVKSSSAKRKRKRPPPSSDSTQEQSTNEQQAALGVPKTVDVYTPQTALVQQKNWVAKDHLQQEQHYLQLYFNTTSSGGPLHFSQRFQIPQGNDETLLFMSQQLFSQSHNVQSMNYYSNQLFDDINAYQNSFNSNLGGASQENQMRFNSFPPPQQPNTELPNGSGYYRVEHHRNINGVSIT